MGDPPRYPDRCDHDRRRSEGDQPRTSLIVTADTRPARHPAKYGATVLDALGSLLETEAVGRGRRLRVLDPFAGTGRIHTLDHDTIGGDLEPEWIGQGCDVGPVVVADALRLPFASKSFDAVVTSPCYGNRLADHHNARDGSVRHSYTHGLGRLRLPAKAGTMQGGEPYRVCRLSAWMACFGVVVPGGLALVNVSDHIRRGDVVPVVAFHVGALERAGWVVERVETVPTPRLRYGANGSARVDGERVIVARKRER